MHVAKGRTAHLHIEVRNFDDVLAAPTGNVAVVVKDVDDDTVSSGNAVASGTTGIYTYTLPSAVTDNLGVYSATATFTLSSVTTTREYEIEVVGDYLFDISELRAYDSDVTVARFPADKVREARELATNRIEEAAMVAFSPRVKRVTLSGDGTDRLLCPDVMVTECIAATVYAEEIGADDPEVLTGTELTDVEIDKERGVLVRTDGQVWPAGSNNVVVDYRHGYDRCPAAVKRAAMILALEYLVPSGMPPRATAQATDVGDFRISVANIDLGRYTGIPEVDAVIDSFGFRRPRLG